MNRILNFDLKATFILAIISTIGCFYLVQGIAHGAAATSNKVQQNTLISIQTKGANQIDQRLTTLNNLANQVSSSTKLSSADKVSLSSEISTEISGLTTLKTQITADTTIDEASTDVAIIFSDYRVYALVVPKVELVTIADNQQSIEGALYTQAQQFQTQISAETSTTKSVTAAKTLLTEMNSSITSAHTISAAIQSTVVPLLPSSWNANHNLFSGDRAQLTTAYKDNTKASNEAKTITNLLTK